MPPYLPHLPFTPPSTLNGVAYSDVVDAERARNREVGEKTGCWKSGVLVEDDAGSVAKYLAEHGAA